MSRYMYLAVVFTTLFASQSAKGQSSEPTEQSFRLIEKGQYGEAITLLDKAIAEASDPRRPIRLGDEVAPLYYNRARAHESLKQYGKALRDYKTACAEDRD